MVYINISVIIIDHNDSSAVGNLFHILRVVRVLLLLLVQVVLVEGLLGHAHLVRADAAVVAGLLLWAVG